MLERYGLKFNPFPRAEAEQYRNQPEKLDIVLFDYEKERLENFAKETQNASISFAVVGPWGTGKTLFLLYLYKMLRQMYGADKVKFIYIKAPSDNEDLIKKLCNDLGISFSSKKIDDSLEYIRKTIKELVQKGYIVYLALDQLEETYRNINNDENLVREFVEIIRGKLSAIVEKSYVLGISIVAPVWSEIINRWPSMTGIESIKLRTLEPDETELFIKMYLDKARDQELIKKYDIETEIKENPTYPFTRDAVIEIYRLSGGVQRNICSWAYELLEKSKDKFDKIDSYITRLQIDKTLYLRQRSMEEILPYHPMRVPMVVKEILSYIGNMYGQKYNIVWIGATNKNIILINIAGNNIVMFMATKQTITSEDLQPIIKYLQEGVTIDNEKIEIAKAIILQFVSQNTSFSKLVDSKASITFLKFGNRIRHKVIFKDSADFWGRLSAYYLYIKKELISYITTTEEEDAEIKKILHILGLSE
jgi:type II secretory pathway predicted ATPase ExeA